LRITVDLHFARSDVSGIEQLSFFIFISNRPLSKINHRADAGSPAGGLKFGLNGMVILNLVKRGLSIHHKGHEAHEDIQKI
jgi:hypothetical protein